MPDSHKEHLQSRTKNEEDLSAQLAGFLEQFLDVFEELKGKKFYISGESVRTPIFFFSSGWGFLSYDELKYAGTYLPCELKRIFFIYYYESNWSFMIDFADYIYDHPGLLDLDLQGMWISDRTWTPKAALDSLNHK